MTFEAEQLGESGTELASLLRDLRKRAGLSGDRLAARCNMSQSKVSRIENGRTRPSLVDVEQILRALNAPPALVAAVSALARMANTEWRNLRELRRKGLGTRQAELKSLEASSTQMRYLLLSMVTGLLATPEYVRASLAHSTADTSKAVAGKLGRQAVLFLILRDSRDVQAYLKEFAGYQEHALFGENLRARLAEWSSSCRA
ncbi:Scr1 family TA system antitoxin-like transcriptional regulator [Streptomyces sp. NPDC097595]|uniref:Scr1 family TA system antitoxin-like transcriptional regulator n=1 Tax=Streptomyces sp. NPDC097595 TaxID=3366090 RepID=UPI003800534F